MLNALIKLFVPKLNGLLLIVALTGFVCTHKIQAEEECLSSKVLCYECDSRYDPNCADPFDFSPTAMGTLISTGVLQTQPAITNHTKKNGTHRGSGSEMMNNQQQQFNKPATNETNSTLSIPQTRHPKKLPTVSVCHGCCVKITSKTQEGVPYVKRLCTTNLQINYFIVGLVCMKESYDRGKMCFCETDYCNGEVSSIQASGSGKTIILLIIITLLILHKIGSLSYY